MTRKITIVLLVLFMIASSIIPSKHNLVYALDGNYINAETKTPDIVKYPTTTDVDFDIAETHIVNEIVSERTANSKTFLRADGTYEVAVYDTNVHYNVNGVWKEINNSLSETENEYAIKDNSFKLKFPKTIKDNKNIKLSIDDYSINWNVHEIQSSNAECSESVEKSSNIKELTSVNQAVVYHDIQDGVDIEYIISGSEVKENIILKEYIKNYSITFEYKVNNLNIIEDSSGNILFVNSENEVIFKFSDMYMFDANNQISFNIDFNVLQIEKDSYLVTITPDDEYLSKGTYPIVIDPTISSIVSSGLSIQDTYYNTTTLTTYPSDSILKCNGFDESGLINFTVPSELKNYNVIFATLNLTTTTSSGGGELYVSEVDDYVDNLGVFSFLSSIGLGTLVNRASIAPGSDSYHIDITYSVNKWNELGIENMPGFKLNSGDMNELIFWSSNASYYECTSTEKPFISIGYYEDEDLSGIKDFWTYNSQDIGSAGTGYISDYTQQLYIIRTDFLYQTELQTLGVSFAYSNNMAMSATPNIGYGKGWNVNYNLMLHFDTSNEEIYSVDFTGNKVYYHELDGCDSRFSQDDVCYIAEDGSGNVLVDFDTSSTYSGASIVTSEGTMYNFNISSGIETYLEMIYELYTDLEITVYRPNSTSKVISYVEDSSDNRLDFDYDSNNRLECITLMTKNSSMYHNLERVYYEYYSSSNFLYDIYYLTDYDIDDDLTLNTSDLTNVDKIVRYDHNPLDLLYRGFVKYINESTGIESLGEEIRYYYYSGDDYKVKQIDSFFDDTKYSQVDYDNNDAQTKISDHSGNFVLYSFDTYGHTISIIDKDANALYYSYIDIFRMHEIMGNNDYDYNLNHTLYSESSPSIPTSVGVTNTSFEDGLVDWDTHVFPVYDTTDFIEINNSEHTSGLHSVCVHNELSINLSQSWLERSITLGEGYYKISIDVKNDSTETGSSARVYVTVNNETKEVVNDGEWHKLSFDFMINSPNTSVDIILGSNSLGDAYFDNLLVNNTFSTSQINLIHNSSFEEGLADDWIIANPSTTSLEQITYDSSDADATFEDILGDQAVKLRGAMQTSIYRQAFDDFIDGDVYSINVGGWSKNLTAPFITNGYTGIFYGITVNQYDNNDDLIEKTEDIDGYNTSIYIPFDLQHNNWQFSYKSMIIDPACQRIDITLVYYGSGDVLFDGITMFFNSNEVINNYDDFGRITGQFFGDDTSILYAYPESSDQYIQIPETVTDREGNITTYSQSNNKITGVLKNNIKVTPTYNNSGQMSSYSVGTSADSDLYFTRTTHYGITGQYTQFFIDEYGEYTFYYTNLLTGLLGWIGNANGAYTNYEYYDDGELRKVYVDYIDDKDNNTTSFVEYIYDEYDRLIKINLDTGFSYNIIYDSMGRMESVQVNNQTLMSYDYLVDIYETNIISSQTYEGTGDIVYFNYDDNNENITSVDFQASGMTRETRFTYSYDPLGRVIIYEDLVISSKEYYEYDSRGNLVTISYDSGDSFVYDYDDEDNLVGFTCNINDETITTNFDYQDSATYSQLYDSTSYNLSGTNDSLKKDYIYEDSSNVMDPLGRLQRVHFTISGVNSTQFDISYSYQDYTSRIEKIEYNFANNSLDFSYEYQYDSIGNILQEIYSFYDSGIQTIQKDYTYDDLNQLIIESSRDSRFLVSEFGSTNYTKYYHYDERSNLYEVNSHKYGEVEGEIYTIPSFLQTNYGSKDAVMEYNLTKDYQDIYSISVGGNVSLSFRYKDVTGLGGPLTFSPGSFQLEDELGDASINRLIIPGDDYIPGMTTTLLSSTLDTSKDGYYYNYYLATNGSDYTIRFRVVIKVGNPVSVYPEESLKSNYKDYSGGWRDQLISYTILEDGVSSTSYITYDNQGNPTKITNFYYEGTRYNHADLSWEGRQLVGIQVCSSYLSSSKIAEIWYTYNDQGIRTSKIIDTNGDGTQDEKYVYRLSGDVVLSEIRYFYTTSWLEDYQIIYSYDYDGSLIGFSYFDGISTEDYIYTFNIQGDVTKILKSDGTVVVEYYYDAYGNVTETVGSMSSTIGKYNSMKYRGYKYDDEIRMYYLNSRYYNPEIGRFINADGLLGEVGNLQTHNMYAYCANNPVMYLDPSGEFPIFLFVASLLIGGIIGGISNMMSKDPDETWGAAFIGGFINGVIVTGAVTLGIAVGGMSGIILSATLGAVGGASGSVITDIISNKSIDVQSMFISAGYSAIISAVLAWGLMQTGIYAGGTFAVRFALAATPDIIAIAAGVLVGLPFPSSGPSKDITAIFRFDSRLSLRRIIKI